MKAGVSSDRSSFTRERKDNLDRSDLSPIGSRGNLLTRSNIEESVTNIPTLSALDRRRMRENELSFDGVTEKESLISTSLRDKAAERRRSAYSLDDNLGRESDTRLSRSVTVQKNDRFTDLGSSSALRSTPEKASSVSGAQRGKKTKEREEREQREERERKEALEREEERKWIKQRDGGGTHLDQKTRELQREFRRIEEKRREEREKESQRAMRREMGAGSIERERERLREYGVNLAKENRFISKSGNNEHIPKLSSSNYGVSVKKPERGLSSGYASRSEEFNERFGSASRRFCLFFFYFSSAQSSCHILLPAENSLGHSMTFHPWSLHSWTHSLQYAMHSISSIESSECLRE